MMKDQIINAIFHSRQRFLKHKNILIPIQNMLPKTIVSLIENEIEGIIDTITPQWPNVTVFPKTLLK